MPSAQQPHDLSPSLPLKRILLTISTLSAGGAERVASELVNHWAARGWTVGLLTLTDKDSDHYSLDPRVERIGLDLIWESNNPWHGFLSNLRRSRMIRQVTKTFSPDVVVSFIEQTNVRVLAALVGTGIPVIVSERVDPRMVSIGPAWEWARRILYPLSAALVVQTRAVTEWAEKLVPSHKVRAIPNCISHLPDPSSFSERA
ncbi:MAG: glycosyltransferase, partial [Gammaproteobacteria bacterium]|nr:glycosyltransferase [Gammaproteobacteria bacterium]